MIFFSDLYLCQYLILHGVRSYNSSFYFLRTFKMKYVFICVCASFFNFVNCESLPNSYSTLNSKYAKVTRYGTNTTTSKNNGRRTANTKLLSNHRLDAKSISTSSQRNKNPSVAYQHAVYPKPQTKIDKRVEYVPGIGEVIVAQDRFEPRPLFAYRNKQGSATYGPPPQPPQPSAIPAPAVTPPPALVRPASPSVSEAPPPLSYIPPVYKPPQNSPSQPSSDIYNSPYSSYNPPDFTPDDSNSNLYPPYLPPASNGDNTQSMDSMDMAATASPMSDMPSSSENPKDNKNSDSYASLGPPLASYGHNDHNYDDSYHGPPPYDDHDQSPDQDHDPSPDYDNHNDNPAKDPMTMYRNPDGPPDYPPKSVDDVYYPDDFPKDQIGKNHYDNKNKNNDMMKDTMMMPPSKNSMQMMDNMNSGKDNGNGGVPDSGEMDLGPPPISHDYGHAFPQYLYDNHHYDHHIYEEVPHTTMAPAKEDKRVSSTHYSYYYLGRKLWYIPLYFSIYFIIYITVLILKSIARHKVRIKYKWYEQDINAKQARNLNLDELKEEEIANIERNVSIGISNATRKYDKNVMAM